MLKNLKNLESFTLNFSDSQNIFAYDLCAAEWCNTQFFDGMFIKIENKQAGMPSLNVEREDLYARVENVLSGDVPIQKDGVEDFILDVLECREPRFVEIIAGYHLSLNVNYFVLARKARERGLVNPLGWLLTRTRKALLNIGAPIPEKIDISLEYLVRHKSEQFYRLTTIPPPHSDVSGEEGKIWKVVGTYGDQGIERSVRRHATKRYH